MAEAQVVGICLSTSSRSWLAGLTGPCDWKEVTTSLFLEAATRVTLDAPFLFKKKKNLKFFCLFVCLACANLEISKAIHTCLFCGFPHVFAEDMELYFGRNMGQIIRLTWDRMLALLLAS